ncbi:MAG: hypothetical protein RLZ81_364 [Pseudomonadota bacterium]
MSRSRAKGLALDSFPAGLRTLIIGALGGIGQAFVQALRAQPRGAEVAGLHRHSEPRLDFDDEASIGAAATGLLLCHFFPLLDTRRGALVAFTMVVDEKALPDSGLASASA